MNETNNDSYYFQAIAQRFLYWSGHSLLLSPKDIDLIDSWKKKNIPLQVVLEGINRAFEKYRAKSGRKEKIKTLYFCEKEVLQTYQQYRDRKVGQTRSTTDSTDERKIKALKEISQFIANIPGEVAYLKQYYQKAIVLIKGGEEEELEKLDSRIESVLLKNCPLNEIKNTEQQISQQWGELTKKQKIKLAQKKIIKNIRKKYKIPYLSLFYY
ncbi:MAG: hypothetical protein ACE5WD_05165 [Candidatus Aminicenantia bacterium]